MILEYFFELTEEFRTEKYYEAHDLSDKLNVIMISVLLISSVSTSYKFIINSPLVCFIVNGPTGESFNDYAMNYVWAHGSIPTSLLNISTMENFTHWNFVLEEKGIHYYQWVPMILFIQFVTLFMCRIFWQSICSTRTFYNLNSLLVKCSNTHLAANEANIKELTNMFLLSINKKTTLNNWLINLRLYFQKRISTFGFSRSFGNWLYSNYVMFKIITIFVCIFQSLAINYIFDIEPWNIFQISAESNDLSHRKFPRSVIGYVPDVAVLGSYNSYTINCIMSVNLINEKLFILLQIMLIVLAVFNGISLLLWIVVIEITNYRIQFIQKYLSNSKKDYSTLIRFTNEYLKPDGLFVLTMIKQTCDNHLVRRLVNELWQRFCIENDFSEINEVPENFLFTYDQMYQYLVLEIKTPDIVIIDPFHTIEVLDGCATLNSFGYQAIDFQSARLILAPLNVDNQFWVLFVYELHFPFSYILDPSTVLYKPNEVHKLGLRLSAEFSNILNIKNIDYFGLINIERYRQSNFDDSGPVVCGYAINMSNKVPLKIPIDVANIRKIVWSMFPD